MKVQPWRKNRINFIQSISSMKYGWLFEKSMLTLTYNHSVSQSVRWQKETWDLSERNEAAGQRHHSVSLKTSRTKPNCGKLVWKKTGCKNHETPTYQCTSEVITKTSIETLRLEDKTWEISELLIRLTSAGILLPLLYNRNFVSNK